MDREKVIKGLEMCKIRYCDECPYDDENSCSFYLNHDALELLKEQQNQIWELQDQVEYLTDKQKEQEKKGKNRLPYSPDSNVQWT